MRWRIEREATRSAASDSRKEAKVNKFSEKLMFMCRSCQCFAYEAMKNKWLYDVTWSKLPNECLVSEWNSRTNNGSSEKTESKLKILSDIEMRSLMKVHRMAWSAVVIVGSNWSSFSRRWRLSGTIQPEQSLDGCRIHWNGDASNEKLLTCKPNRKQFLCFLFNGKTSWIRVPHLRFHGIT